MRLASPFSDVQAIVFDLDDTLCNYWDAAKAGLRAAFHDVTWPVSVTEDEFVAAWADAFRDFCPTLKKTGWYETYLKTGEPTRTETMRHALRLLNMDDDGLARRVSDAYHAQRQAHLRLFDEVPATLDALSPHFPFGLMTNGPADIQRDEIAVLGLESRFQVVLIDGEVGRGKPHEVVFRQAEAALNCAPANILMVGNSYHHDIVPAIEFGWQTAWIRRPSDVPPSSTTGKPEERPEGGPEPTAIITGLDQLLA